MIHLNQHKIEFMAKVSASRHIKKVDWFRHYPCYYWDLWVQNRGLTYNMLNYLKDYKRFRFWIISWIWLDPNSWNQLWNNNRCCVSYIANIMSIFKISARPRTLTGKTGVSPTGFPSLPYINFGKIVLQSGKFQILFWRLPCLLMLWWLMSQGIRRHGIDNPTRNIPSPASKKLK